MTIKDDKSPQEIRKPLPPVQSTDLNLVYNFFVHSHCGDIRETFKKKKLFRDLVVNKKFKDILQISGTHMVCMFVRASKP